MTEQVEEFHRTYGLPVETTYTLLDDRKDLRYSLIFEELCELSDAMKDNDIVEVADALGDLMYVVIGAALEFGIPIDDVVDEIHRSNMSKLDENGSPIYREDGKVLKGPGYFPPNIAKILGVE
jgi:predicted HAD superfamily Cof-like phosphohydrolase